MVNSVILQGFDTATRVAKDNSENEEMIVAVNAIYEIA